MDITALDNHINLLDEAIATLQPSRVRQLEWLRYDLDHFARNALGSSQYRKAWDRILYDRLEAIIIPDRIRPTIDKIKATARAASSGASMRIHFGQQRVAGTFQSQNVNQAALPGFPDAVANSPLALVQAGLAQGQYSADQIPVQVFWHVQSNKWVAANNRGYTVHCLARVRPLRILLTTFQPHDIEITRLAEVEGQGGIPNWTGVRGGEPNPRTLPSTRMFITPVGNAITQVAEVPAGWG